MPSSQWDAVAAKAAELGSEMDVPIVQLESAVVLGDLYDAVTDGRCAQALEDGPAHTFNGAS